MTAKVFQKGVFLKTAPFKTKDKIMMKLTTIFFRKNKTNQDCHPRQ